MVLCSESHEGANGLEGQGTWHGAWHMPPCMEG